MAFVEQLYAAYSAYATNALQKVASKKPRSLTISSSGVFWGCLYNVTWSAALAKDTFARHDAEDAIGVDIDVSAIRSSYKAFPKQKAFFVQRHFPDNEDERPLLKKGAAKLEKWFAGKSKHMPEHPLGNAWLEWELLLQILAADCMGAVATDLAKKPPFDKVALDIEDKSRMYADDLVAYRRAAKYKPSAALVRDVVSRFASNAEYIDFWSKLFVNAKDPPAKVRHPITGAMRSV